MRIFAAGIATETNTFAPLPTGMEDFQILRREDMLAGRIDHPSLDLSAVWGKAAQAQGHELVCGLTAWAQPSGITLKATYESLRDEMLEDLRAVMPVDVVLLLLHGAMVAEGYDDCEADMIRRVREIVGPDAVVGVELDLHCHLNPAKIAAADIVITFKEYPHVDIDARAQELFALAVAAKGGKIKPTMALFDCHMIGMYPTSAQPLRSFVDDMTKAEQRPGVLSVSFGHGFQFADVPHVGANMLVVTDNNPALAQEVAREFGTRVYGLRKQIGFDSMSLPMEQALSKALTGRKPVVVADQSDNAGGGAPSDSTFALRWLLERKAHDVAMAIFCDPTVVKIAKKAGVGASLKVRLGGKMNAQSGDPVDLKVTVLAVRENHAHWWPQQSGDPLHYSLGDTVALRCEGIDLVVSSERCQCFSPAIFSDIGIDPHDKQALIVKSTQHFYGAFAPMAGEVVYMSAPGAVPPDPKLLTYQRLDTSRLYPWVDPPSLT